MLKIDMENDEIKYNDYKNNIVDRNYYNKIITKMLIYNKIRIITNIMICFIVFADFNTMFINIFIYGLIIKLINLIFIEPKIIYNFDEINEEKYFIIKQIILNLNKSDKVWVTSDNSIGRTNLERFYIKIKKTKNYIKCNKDIYFINFFEKKIFIMPDRIIYIDKNKKKSILYEDLELELYKLKVVENDIDYKDTIFVKNNYNEKKNYYGRISLKNVDFNLYISNYLNLFEICILTEKYKFITNKKIVEDINNEIFFKPNEFKNNTKQNNFEKTKIKDYKIPTLDVIKEQSSFNVKRFIKEMKKSKETFIPIGSEEGKIYYEKISEIKNFLIAGTTMSGKSTYLQTIISSIILTRTPEEVALFLFTNTLDLCEYNGIPHLICDVCSSIEVLETYLRNISKEISNRVEMLTKYKKRSAIKYNEKIESEFKMKDIIIIIDTQSDTLLSELVKRYIEYITIYGPRVNIYTIMATNLTLLKENQTFTRYYFPARLCFRVTTKEISKSVIGECGAETLSPGMGYYISNFSTIPSLITVPFISENDTTRIIEYWKNS